MIEAKYIDAFAVNLDSIIKAGHAVSKVEAWEADEDDRVIVAALDRSGSVLVAIAIETDDRLAEIEAAFSAAAGIVGAMNEFSKRLN